MKCIECQYANLRACEEYAKLGMCDCLLQKKCEHGIFPLHFSLTFERDCKLFKKADDEAIVRQVEWFNGIKRNRKSEVINGDRVYRQKMEMKREKQNGKRQAKSL